MTLAALVVTVSAPLIAQPKPPVRVTHAWDDKSLSADRRAELVLEQMTLEEKISLVHGAGMTIIGPTDPSIVRSRGGAGFVPGIARLGIPDLNLADSAVGIARGGQNSRYATPLPSALCLASSWDAKLGHEYGALIGRELRDQGYNVFLGGGVNITREPRNGRNFEYVGEDPILAGKMVSQVIQGVQDQNVIGDVKHFVLNDQETGRNYGSANIDKRSMRETDLLPFEIAIKEADPGMVMCSYNRINGEFACENDYTLNQVLKKTWGFKGWVISDWFGTHTTVKAALAGLDQEQPGSKYFGEDLRKAVENGQVPVSRLNDMVRRILRTEFAKGIVDNPPAPKVVDVFGGLELAQKVEEQGIVLLKNARQVLPLMSLSLKTIAVIGGHADVGVLSGGGSAQVDPPGGNAVPPPPPPPGQNPIETMLSTVVYHPSSPLKAIRGHVPGATVAYNAGTDSNAAAALAKASEVAIVFVGQPASEGRDVSLSLPDNQDELVKAVAAANARTIVVLETGGPVAMPWADQVQGIMEAWYPGIRGGEAIANVLFGALNPSGKLAVSFAKSEADLPHPRIAEPAEKHSPFEGALETLPPFDINYTEGLKVGYKWFDAEDKAPQFAFGHGLSYTTFGYSDIKVTAKHVTFTVTNTGKRAGAEIAQVYIGLPAAAQEPPTRLVAWQKVLLAPGESKTVTTGLEPLFLSVFNTTTDRWELTPGRYKVFVGASSRSLPLTSQFEIR